MLECELTYLERFDAEFEKLISELENWDETLANRVLPIKPKNKINFESIVAVSAKESIYHRKRAFTSNKSDY